MRSLGLVAGVLTTFSLSVALAAEIRGQDDLRFQAALALWLDDDDAAALPQLGGLAAEGNRAAQVLLALVDVAPPLQGPWLTTLPRAERNALMRSPGGLSGRSWMQSAAEDTLLAKLWIEQPTPNADADTARGFAVTGELRAARLTLYDLARRQYHGFAEMAEDPSYPPDMRYLIWLEWADEPSLLDRLEVEVSGAHPGDPQLARFDLRPIDPVALEDWLAEAELAAPLRGACAALCPETAKACVSAAFDLVGASTDMVSGHIGLTALGTPSESLISPEVWNLSSRNRTALLRQSAARFNNLRSDLERIAGKDACLGRAIFEDVKRFSG